MGRASTSTASAEQDMATSLRGLATATAAITCPHTSHTSVSPCANSIAPVMCTSPPASPPRAPSTSSARPPPPPPAASPAPSSAAAAPGHPAHQVTSSRSVDPAAATPASLPEPAPSDSSDTHLQHAWQQAGSSNGGQLVSLGGGRRGWGVSEGESAVCRWSQSFQFKACVTAGHAVESNKHGSACQGCV
jgi:hypothetical protein